MILYDQVIYFGFPTVLWDYNELLKILGFLEIAEPKLISRRVFHKDSNF